MSFRVFQGHVLSAEGWRMCNADECIWVDIPGAPARIQVRSGIPAVILPAFIARYHQLVEPVRDRDTACWTLGNSVSTSNHPAGVACDVNWELHPFHVFDTFGDRLPKLRQVQDEFRGCIQWGGDWGGNPQDEMHHELNYPEGYLDRGGNFVLAVDGRLINLANDLRAGYLGIYVPGQTPAPTRADGYATKIIHEGQRRGITPRGQQIALSVALVESNLTMYANSNVPESLDIPHDKVGSDHDSVGLFQQRCPMWGPANVLMDPTASAGLFYDRLVKLDYNGSRLPGEYAADVQRPAAQYRGRYQERMAEAVTLYDRLAHDTTGDDDMALVPQDQWDRLFHEVTDLRQSRSPLRHLGEGKTDTWSGFGLNTDGHTHVELVTRLAGYGDPDALALLHEVAGGEGDTRYPDRQHDALVAQSILADLTSPIPAGIGTARVDVQPRLLPPVHDATQDAPATGGSTGAVIGRAYDALEALKSAQVALSPEAQVAMDSLISVLQPTGVTP